MSGVLKSNRPIVLKNNSCVYCGKDLIVHPTREHVVGKNFVPSTKWRDDWNLIVKACQDCNHHKSKLEDDISAITLLIHSQDPSISNLVQRKMIGSKSTKTGVAVGKSNTSTSINLPLMAGVNFNFKLSGPPQIDDERAFELARLHISAFYYLITFNKDSSRGGFWLGKFSPIACLHKGDWGNVTKMSFMREVYNWELRFNGVTADGYFKAMIRKHPTNECWAWAVEWNISHRVYGFFGDRKIAENIFETFDQPVTEKLQLNKDEYYFLRTDIPLSEVEDTLFGE